MQVLIVRLSSMGDILHTLPALTDAARALPEARFDWLTDRAFAEIAEWHSNLDSAIAVPSRAFGGGRIWAAIRTGHYGDFLKTLRRKNYDMIVDLQGEWKSAVAAKLAKGPVKGYNAASVHEWGAQVFYQEKFFVSKEMHSIHRMRSLLSQALGYPIPSELEYGIDPSRLPAASTSVAKPYLVFIHSTSWQSKCWPELYWQQLVALALREGFSIVLPWGTDAERERALRIAGDHDRISVLPKLSISEKAAVIAAADGTVGLDTGLSHIAAAFGIPSVTLYGATDPNLIGATGKNQVHIASDFECVKCHQSTCSYPGEIKTRPACFEKILPDQVWVALTSLLNRVQAV